QHSRNQKGKKAKRKSLHGRHSQKSGIQHRKQESRNPCQPDHASDQNVRNDNNQILHLDSPFSKASASLRIFSSSKVRISRFLIRNLPPTIMSFTSPDPTLPSSVLEIFPRIQRCGASISIAIRTARFPTAIVAGASPRQAAT